MGFDLAFNPPQFLEEYDGVKMRQLVEELERLHAVLTSDVSDEGVAAGVDSFNARTGTVLPLQADYDSFFLTPAEGNAAYSPLGHSHSHTALSDIGTNTHTQIDTHLALTAEHIDWAVTGAEVIHADRYTDNDTTDHTALTNIGTNTHAQIDTHLALAAEHIDWAVTGAEVIHADRYTDNDTIYSHPNHSGDVTSVGDGAQTIAADAVTYAKMQNAVAANVILGNVGIAGSIIAELTAAQVRTMINVEDGSTADQTAGEIEAIVSHDNLVDFLTAEHIDWAVTGAEVIHADRYTDNDTTDHTALSNIGTNTHAQIDTHLALTAEHINWSITGAEDVHVDRIASVAVGVVTAHEASLTILETQITDGAILARVAANESISGDWNWQDNIIQRPEILDYGVTEQVATVSANAVAVNLALGNVVSIDMDPATAAVALTLSNPPTSGTYGEVLLIITMGTPAYGITWPGSVSWQGGAPSLTTTNNEIDLVHLITVDGGVTWRGTHATAAASANTLEGLTDTTVTSPAEASMLLYDTGTAKWIDNIMGGDATMLDTGIMTIANNAISLAKMADIATASFIGRNTAATGDPEVLSATTARSILNVEDGSTADQTAAEIEAIVSHDNLVDFLGAEHIDWAVTGAENIHADRYTDTIYSHPNHSGDVTSTGDGAQVIDPTAISGKTLVTAVATDMVLLWDATDSALKRADISDLLGGSGGGAILSANYTWGGAGIPAAGEVRSSTSTLNSLTLLRFDDDTSDGVDDFAAIAAQLRLGQLIQIAAADDLSEYNTFRIDGAIVDQTTRWDVPVKYVGGTQSASGNFTAASAVRVVINPVEIDNAVNNGIMYLDALGIVETDGDLIFTGSIVELRGGTNLSVYSGTDADYMRTRLSSGDTTAYVEHIGAGNYDLHFEDWNSMRLYDGSTRKFILDLQGSIQLAEQAAAITDIAAMGQIWVKNDVPNTLWFTNDAGTDVQLGVSAAEVNDLTVAVTWANVPDANITQTSVTQHEAALTILESQITDGTILARVGSAENISADWNWQDNIIQRPEILDYGVTEQVATVSANAVTANLALGNVVSIDMDPATADVALTLSNPPGSGTYGEVLLIITMGTPAHGITWPGTVTWQGSAPTLTTTNNEIDLVHLITVDGGATWRGTHATSAGAASGTLSGLTDTTITAAATGDFLRHNGTAWVDYPETSIATVGTITAGVWSGTALLAAKVPNHDNLNGVTANEHIDWTAAAAGTIHTDNYIENVPTALSIGTITGTTYGITSDGGANDIILPEANTTQAGLLGAAKWDEIVANSLKTSNISTALSIGTITATTYGITSDGSANDIILPEANTTQAGLLGAVKWDEIVANSLKVTNATHTGDVTGATLLTIAAKAVDIAMLADGTDGELITWSAAGVAATVATGNSGQVLTSNGVGTAPTFQTSGAAGFTPKSAMFVGSGTAAKSASATWLTVNLATEYYDTNTNYSLSADIITVTDAGDYLISYVYTFHPTGGATNDSVMCKMTKNGTATLLPGSQTQALCYKANTRPTQVTCTFLASLAASDTVRLRQRDETGTSGTELGTSINVTLTKVA